MSITLLYGCCQIETTTRDLGEVRAFLIDVLGGGPIEQTLAQQISDLIPGDEYDVDHIDCGEAVFQVNQPSASMTYRGRKSIHQQYLDRRGPSVTNLNYFIDDVVHARDLLASLGAETHIEGPSSAAKALTYYGPDNTREGAEERPFLFMGTRHLLGFDLEIMEPNFLHFSRQSAQFPAFMRPRPETGDGNLVLQRLIVAVPDLLETRKNLVKIFAPASRSKPYGLREGPLGQALRVSLGGIEIEFCQPSSGTGELAAFLRESGEGVIAIAFAALDEKAVVERSERSGVAAGVPGTDLLGLADAGVRLASRAVSGFDVLLEQRPSCEPA